MTTAAAPTHARLSDVAGGNTHDTAVQALRELRRGQTLRQLKILTGVNVGTLSAVLRGKRNPPTALYIALGLTPTARVVEVPAGFGVGRACASCGQVHTTKTCTAKRKPKPRQVLRKWGTIRYGDQPGRDGDRL